LNYELYYCFHILNIIICKFVDITLIDFVNGKRKVEENWVKRKYEKESKRSYKHCEYMSIVSLHS